METSSSLGRFARRLRWASLASAVVLAAITLLASVAPEAWGVAHVTAAGLTRGQGTLVALVSMALLIAGLIELAHMLGGVERGEPFAPTTTRRFRRFALFLLLAAAAEVVLPLLIQAWLVAFAGGRQFMFNMDDGELVHLLLGAVLFLVARLFDEAARLQEDSRSII